MLRPLPLAQTISPQQQTQPPVNQQQPDAFWSVVGQYGVGAAALLALLKAYADYQLKAAAEDRALRAKESSQALETKERIYGNLVNQNETLSSNQGQLLNTFINKTLEDAKDTNAQINELVKTITTLTEAIKFLGDGQSQYLEAMEEVKASLEHHSRCIESLTSIANKLLNATDNDHYYHT